MINIKLKLNKNIRLKIQYLIWKIEDIPKNVRRKLRPLINKIRGVATGECPFCGTEHTVKRKDIGKFLTVKCASCSRDLFT